MKKTAFLLALFVFISIAGCSESSEGLNPTILENENIVISEEVTLSVTPSEGRKVEVVLSNDSDQAMEHGHFIYLEKKINGSWYQIPEIVGYADESLTILPGEEFIVVADLNNWPKTEAGTFRMYKISSEAGKPFYESAVYSVSNEFEIKK